MPRLDSLPFDVLFGVSLNLDVEDIVHLSNSCRQLRFLLTEETLCRKLVEVWLYNRIILNTLILHDRTALVIL